MSDLLLERAAELAAIDRAIRMARAGCGRLVLFAGPPGSGRTALLERARARATAQRLTVLAAGGEVGERDFPLAVARRLIEPAERYDALLELTRRLAAAAPAMVTVDDLHLCDVASVDWLGFVARRLRRHGIALVAGVDASETALISTLEETGARVLNLKPFSERAVAAWLRVERGQVVAAEIVRACHHATGGNPLVLRELDPSEPDRVTPGIARLLDRRLAPLPAEARSLAHAVAVLGSAATLRDAAELARLGPDAAAYAADRLLEAGLLDREALTLAPPLVGRAVYHRIPPARRALMHAQAARLTGARPAEVTRHLLHSEPAADPWVETTLRGAARRALAQGEPGDATVLLCRAAREAVGGDRADLFTEMALADRRLGDVAEIAHLQAALDLAPGRADVTTPLALARLAHGRPVAVAGAEDEELHAARTLYSAFPPSPEDAPDVGEASELAANADPERFTFFRACAALIEYDQLAAARAHLGRALAHARRLGSTPVLVQSEGWLAVAALHAGELEAAVVHATTALGAGRHMTLAVPARAALTLALIELDRAGDADALDDADTPRLLYARGRLRLARWDARALDDFLAAGVDPTLPWRSAAALARAPDALALALEEHELAVRFGGPRSIGISLRALAAVGPPSERTERCREAVAVLAAGEARLEYAHALCDLGASLRRTRARREAREPLRQALDIAVRCGAEALARRAREELAASGARPRRLAQSGRDSLTPAELRVASLAARGLANREIAQSLFVTVKTVETELGHAYAKLGIRSRHDLATALTQN